MSSAAKTSATFSYTGNHHFTINKTQKTLYRFPLTFFSLFQVVDITDYRLEGQECFEWPTEIQVVDFSTNFLDFSKFSIGIVDLVFVGPTVVKWLNG